MTDILIRSIPDEIIERLDAQAAQRRQSRQNYLLTLLENAVGSEWVPDRFGEGYRAFTPTGGKASIIYNTDHVAGGATNLSQAEFDAYKKAKMLADPKNGSRWAEARQALIDAGFEVWNV